MAIGLRSRNNKSTDKEFEVGKRPVNRNNRLSDSGDLDKNKKRKPVAYAGPEQIVYEGGKVRLEGSCNLDQNKERPNENIIYDWSFVKEQSDMVLSQQEFEDTKNPVFEASYVDFQPSLSTKQEENAGKDNNASKEKYKTSSSLKFKLVVTDKSTNLKSDPSFVTIIVKMVQRALILQGGGALGAYELGAYKALCEKLIAKDITNGENLRRNRPLFDIIAGTSIGALNAALIVGSVVRSMSHIAGKNSEGDSITSPDVPKIWNESVELLEKLWQDLTWPFVWITNSNPFFTEYWNAWNKLGSFQSNLLKRYFSWYHHSETGQPDLQSNYLNPYYLFFRPDIYTPPADAEAARRFFCWLLFPYASFAQIITPNFVQPDTKFFAGIPQFTRFDNRPLVNLVERHYWNSKKEPIATDYLKGEPRLLLVSVDVLDTTSAVTFDSYLCKTEYPKGVVNGSENLSNEIGRKRREQQQQQQQRLIEYPRGVTMEHVRASMSPYTVIDYPALQDNQNYETRYFWDGAFLSNTPLRELLHLHRYYWHDVLKIDHVPHLEIYIVNLYPTAEKNQKDPPKDADTIQDREIDIRFHDRTRYDVKVSEVISDYLILHGQLKNLATKYINLLSVDGKEGDTSLQERFEKDYEELLNEVKTHSKGRREEAQLERIVAAAKKHKSEDDRDTDISTRQMADNNARTYKDLIYGRFDVAKVVYVNRYDDGQTIFGKAAEFSRETMENLIHQGYEDARVAFDLAMKSRSNDENPISGVNC